MYCSRCGIESTDSTNFCPSCGLDLAATTPIAAIRDRMSSPESEIEMVRRALKDDYEIDRELGRGGMAVVFMATEKALDREVALKVLPSSLSHDEEFVERFQREARTAARLEHPNIIPVYRVGKVDNVIYFAMKFLRGNSLADILKERGPLEPDEIRELLKQCAGALGYAHHHSIVHRDIKPDNIMYSDRGQAIVTDFGIAKAASGTKLTGTGMAIGTPYYMSPEQARAQPVDGRSDLYSLGVVAYQCLVGSVPFDGGDSFSIGYKHITEELAEPELSTADHRSFFAIIKRMMAKDPADRYQDADELIAELDGKPAPARAARAPRMSEAATVMSSPPPSGLAAAAGLATPTTPMPSSSMAPVSVAGQKKRSGVLVSMLVMLILGGVGGGGYYYLAVLDNDLPVIGALLSGGSGSGDADGGGSQSNPEGPLVADQDSQPVLVAQGLSDTASADTTTSVDGTGTAEVVATGGTPSDTASDDPPPPPPPPETRGTLVLTGAPSGARVTVDGAARSGFTHRIENGSHRVVVRAAGYEDFSAPANIVAGRRTTVQVQMTALPPPNQCDTFDLTYNIDGSCFDARAKPTGIPVVMVANPAALPDSLITVAIKVSASGETESVLMVKSSGNALFDRLAIQFANDSMPYTPAMKDNRPVESWTQQVLRGRAQR